MWVRQWMVEKDNCQQVIYVLSQRPMREYPIPSVCAFETESLSLTESHRMAIASTLIYLDRLSQSTILGERGPPGRPGPTDEKS